jgi:hypothetical protein
MAGVRAVKEATLPAREVYVGAGDEAPACALTPAIVIATSADDAPRAPKNFVVLDTILPVVVLVL